MNLSFRPGLPEDALAATPLIYSSGPAFLDYIFWERAQEDVHGFLRYAFATNRGELACGRHTVAILDGVVTAIGIGYSGHDLQRFMFAGIGQVLRFYGPLAGVRIVRRALRAEKLMVPPDKDMLYIAHLGVAEEARGRGIGAQLVRELVRQGQEAGRRVAALDVAVTNPRAQALYERLGFEVVEAYPSDLKNDRVEVPGHYRMELQL